MLLHSLHTQRKSNILFAHAGSAMWKLDELSHLAHATGCGVSTEVTLLRSYQGYTASDTFSAGYQRLIQLV